MIVKRSAAFPPALILLCALLLLSASCQTGNEGPDQRPQGPFSLEQLQADFSRLRSVLESNHPDPYRYESAADLGALFDSAYGSLRDGMTEAELYRLAAPLVARFHCGHTQLRHSSAFYNALAAGGRVLPLGIYLDGGRAYVDADYGSGSGVRLGSEVLAIDGEPMAAIVARLTAGIPADARNESLKVRRLNREFYLHHLFWHGDAPSFALQVRDPADNSESLLPVDARPYAQVSQAAAGRFPWASAMRISSADGLAVLTVPTFVAGQNPNYRTFLSEAFRGLNDSGVKRLIIDIRGNGGGDPDVSAALIAHLADRPFVYFKNGISYPHLFAETAPDPVHFAGSVVVLIDGGCFSTSGHFCALVRHLGLATFVGETGGGTFRCHDNSFETVLANTGLRLRVARTTFEAAVPDQDVSAGFPPDFRVYPSIGDVLAGRDVQLDVAVGMLRQGD
jgi:hypothetical protein